MKYYLALSLAGSLTLIEASDAVPRHREVPRARLPHHAPAVQAKGRLHVSVQAYEAEKSFFLLAEYTAPKGVRILPSSQLHLIAPTGFEISTTDKNIPLIDPSAKEPFTYKKLLSCWVVTTSAQPPSAAKFIVSGTLDLARKGSRLKQQNCHQELKLEAGEAIPTPDWSDEALQKLMEIGSAPMQSYAKQEKDSETISLVFSPAFDETPQEVFFIPYHDLVGSNGSCKVGKLEKHPQGYRLPLEFSTPPMGSHLRGTLIWKGGHAQIDAYIER